MAAGNEHGCMEGKTWPARSEQTTKIYRSQKMEGEMIGQKNE